MKNNTFMMKEDAEKEELLPMVSRTLWWKEMAEDIVKAGRDCPTDIGLKFLILIEAAEKRGHERTV
jgi:hypothetical protein